MNGFNNVLINFSFNLSFCYISVVVLKISIRTIDAMAQNDREYDNIIG